VPRPEFGDAPMMPLMVEGIPKNPLAAKGFEYWMTIHSGPDKWLALPPRSPGAYVDVYRDAFPKLVSDGEFIERTKKIADDFTPVPFAEVETWIKKMGSTPPEVLDFIAMMIRGQGVKVEP
jgi:hypothetical protein